MIKKISKFAGLLMLLILFFYILDLFLYTGFQHPFLQIQASRTPIIITNEFQCNDNLQLRINEKTYVKRGNYFESGTRSEIVKDRWLLLSTPLGETPFKQELTKSKDFSLNQSFLRTYVLNDEYLLEPVKTNHSLWLTLSIGSNTIEEEDFGLVADCIRQNQIEIEKSLLTVQKIFPIGSLTLENSFVNNTFRGSTVYECTNGQTAAVIDMAVMTLVVGNLNAGNGSYDNITNFIGHVSSNGKIYSRDSANLNEQKSEVPILDLICTDSKGQFLQSYISSIPERITNMDNKQ